MSVILKLETKSQEVKIKKRKNCFSTIVNKVGLMFREIKKLLTKYVHCETGF